MDGHKDVEMVILASLKDDMKVQLNPEGLKVIEKFVEGQIVFVTMQGFNNKQYKISQSFTRSKLRSHTSGSKIWIRPEPVLDKRTHKYLFFLETQMHQEESKQILNAIASLISFVVVVAIQQDESIHYLSSIRSKISDEKSGTSYLSPESRFKVANLLCIMPSDIKSQNGDYFSDISGKLLEKLSVQGIQNQVSSSYLNLKCLGCPQKDLEYSSQELQKYLLEEVEIFCESKRENSELMYGPILAEYLKNIIRQLNVSGKINMEVAENDIEIEQAYEAYSAGVNEFHKVSLQSINRVERPDDAEVTSSLDLARKAANQEYFTKGGASNMKYKQLLDDYMNHRETQVRRAYSLEQNNVNLQILETESDIILDRIKRENKTRDQQYIKDQLQAMKRNYEHQARGPEKYTVYNDYMKIFTPIAYGYDEKEAQIREKKRIHDDLTRQLNQLKKKKGGCCSGKCQIM